MTITEFLEARIAEDEALANTVLVDQEERGWGGWREGALEDGHGLPAGDLTAEYSPARVLAECAAKRAILFSLMSCQHAKDADPLEFGAKLVMSGMIKAFELAVKQLAAAYASHADYRQEWAL